MAVTKRRWLPGQRPVDHDDVLELVAIDGSHAIGTIKSDTIVAKGRVRADGELVTIGSRDDIELLRALEGRLVAIMPVHLYEDEPPPELAAEAEADRTNGLPPKRLQ